MKAVYHIHRGYRKVEVWEGNAAGERICRHTCTPLPDCTRVGRYHSIVGFLHRRFKIKAPEYISTKAESQLTAFAKTF